MSRAFKTGSMPGADKRIMANTANAVRIIGARSRGITPALSRMSTDSRSKEGVPPEGGGNTCATAGAFLAHPTAIVSARVGAIHDRYGIFCFRGSTSAAAYDRVGMARSLPRFDTRGHQNFK